MSGQPSYLGVVTAGWVAALKNSDSLERRLAAHALAEIGRMAPEAAPPLIEALRDSESFVRVWAAAALARVEPKHPAVHQAGIYAGKILSGAKAADVPGHRADEFMTSLKTATA